MAIKKRKDALFCKNQNKEGVKITYKKRQRYLITGYICASNY